MLLTQVTPAQTSQKRSHPRRRVRSKRTFKRKKVWGADEIGRSSPLGLQMQLANLATSTIASAARMFQF